MPALRLASLELKVSAPSRTLAEATVLSCQLKFRGKIRLKSGLGYFYVIAFKLRLNTLYLISNYFSGRRQYNPPGRSLRPSRLRRRQCGIPYPSPAASSGGALVLCGQRNTFKKYC